MDQVRDQKNTDEYWTENLALMQAMKKLKEEHKWKWQVKSEFLRLKFQD